MTLKHIFLASRTITALAGGDAQAQQSAVSNQRTLQDQSEGQGTQIFVGSAGVRQIQQALTQKGYSRAGAGGRAFPIRRSCAAPPAMPGAQERSSFARKATQARLSAKAARRE